MVTFGVSSTGPLLGGCNLTVDNSGGGTVISDDGNINCGEICKVNYTESASVTMVASPEPGYVFDGWGGVCAELTECIVNISQVSGHKTVSARFTNAIQQGVFIDSLVQGVRYKTSSNLQGVTNNKGEFQFVDGDTVNFYVGDVLLGSVRAGDLVTILEMDNPEQVAMLLQSIDDNKDPEDGIVISSEMQALFENSVLTIEEVNPDDPSFKAKYKTITGEDFVTDALNSFSSAKLAIALELLSGTKFYDYYTGNIDIYNNDLYNKDELKESSEKRMRLYYYSAVVGPQLRMEASRIWDKIESVEDRRQQQEELYKTSGELIGSIVTLNSLYKNLNAAELKATQEVVDLGIVDEQFADALFGNVADKQFEEIRKAVASTSLLKALDSEEIKAIFGALPDPLVDALMTEFKLLFSCVGSFKDIGGCITSIGTEALTTFNDAYTSWNIAGGAEDMNTNVVVAEYLRNYYRFAGNMFYMYNEFGLSLANEDELIQKIAEAVLVPSVGIFTDGNYRYDLDIVKSKILQYKSMVYLGTDSIIRNYDLQRNLSAEVGSSNLDVSIQKGKTTFSEDQQLEVCYLLTNNTYLSISADLVFSITSAAEDTYTLGTVSNVSIDKKENEDDCVSYAVNAEIYAAILDTPYLLKMEITYNEKTASDSQILEITTQNALADLITVLAAPIVKVRVSLSIDGVIYLDASNSSVHKSQGELSYSWEQVLTADDPVVELADSETDKASFIPPELAAGQESETLYFKLLVISDIGQKVTTQFVVVELEKNSLISDLVFSDSDLQRCILDIASSNDYVYTNELTEFNCISYRYNNVDLSILSNFSNLESISLGFFRVTDLAALSNLTRLTFLRFQNSDVHNNYQITDLSPLSNLINLTYLVIPRSSISDLSPIANLTELTRLEFYNSQINDLSPLANLINLSYFAVSPQVSNLSPLSGLTSLKNLWISNNQVSDLSPLVNLTSLQVLGVSNNQINDISSLANLTNLRGLFLDMNQVTNISPLTNLTNLVSLDLRDNPIEDCSLSPVENSRCIEQ